MRLASREIFDAPACMARELLERWIAWASRSRLEPMQDAAKTMKAHTEGILNWRKSHIAYGIQEDIDSTIQAAKAKASDYRFARNLSSMIYMIAGKRYCNLPT